MAPPEGDQRLPPGQSVPARLAAPPDRPERNAWKGPKWVRGIEYLAGDRRGFWEERGHHNLADPWLEQRYSYQESDY